MWGWFAGSADVPADDTPRYKRAVWVLVALSLVVASVGYTLRPVADIVDQFVDSSDDDSSEEG